MIVRFRAITILLVVVAAIVHLHPIHRAWAFCTLTSRWPSGPVTMAHNLPPTGQLINGTVSWAQNAESAMQDWSDVSDDFRFINGGPSGSGQGNIDGVNNMVFGDDAGGDAFDEDVLALTLTRTDLSGLALESDIIFNRDVTWNAYDGPLRVDADGQVVFDFRRVVLHELGHVLGLDHPDSACDQEVEAIMNAQTTEIDRLTTDDRNGLSFIYALGNEPPFAEAGPDQVGDGTGPFVLNGGRSFDHDGVIELYEWRIDGELVARGRVAEISLRKGTHLVELTVTDDDGASATDTLVINVGSEFTPPRGDNERPVADAGPDVTVQPGRTVLLDGSRSFDPDGSIDRYVWSEGNAVLGREPMIRLSLPEGVHRITLTVFDDREDTASDSVLVTVQLDAEPSPDDGGPAFTDPTFDDDPAINDDHPTPPDGAPDSSGGDSDLGGSPDPNPPTLPPTCGLFGFASLLTMTIAAATLKHRPR